jgi:uncharacterized RDD family membrane protein YckC
MFPRETPMRCPSCGASVDHESCAECGTVAVSEAEMDAERSPQDGLADAVQDEAPPEESTRSILIEFPGLVRSTVPEWRRELSERVREVQERRAREAAQEAAEAERRRLAAEAAEAVPQLELLPQASAQPLNPLVAAALRRIERANQQTASPSSAVQAPNAASLPLNPLVAAALRRVERANQQTTSSSSSAHSPNARRPAVAFAADDELESAPKTPSPAYETIDRGVPDQTEKIHNLEMVPVLTNASVTKAEPVPRRLIRESDAALDYLAPVPATLRLDEIRERQAGMLSRVVAALIDLVVCALLFSPFAAVIELTNGDWYKVRTVAFAIGFATFVTFLYLTFSTALTGRTLGLRVLSLRTVDRRTGLIPTGAQSVGRTVIFLASLFALGLPVLYALIQRDGHTVHDHFTGTVVVRV